LTYKETLDFLYAQLPMYQRVGKAAYKKDLTNTLALCSALDNPQNKFKSIHIAGTNGKGSTAHMLAAIYQNNGYKTGLYTSPHLVDFRERIKIDGKLCSEEFVVDFVQRIKPLIQSIQPSFFEITVAMAFLYFAEQQVDIAIIETGLGGRLDSTNVIKPLCSIITSIGFDHMDMLGDTLEKIAGEKAGIIKEETPVVIGKLPKEAVTVMETKARAKKAPIFFREDYPTDVELKGIHQQWNAQVAVKAVEVLQDALPTETLKTKAALRTITSLTGLEGRWQLLNEDPIVICDVAHNEEGVKLIAESLKEVNRPIYYILGFVKDKKLEDIIPLLPIGENYAFVTPTVIRGMDANDTKAAFRQMGIAGTAYDKLSDALNTTLNKLPTSGQSPLIFIGGSNFIVADLLHLRNEQLLPF
jgi:dihydrofolate synthase/folylpolyglutamate synthase